MDLVGGVCVPDDELAVLRGRDEMSSVGGPVHGVDLCKMALEGALGLHGQARESLDSLLSDIADWIEMLAGGRHGGAADIRVVSASSSFFRFILSLRASASRRATWIRCWMDSALISAML